MTATTGVVGHESAGAVSLARTSQGKLADYVCETRTDDSGQAWATGIRVHGQAWLATACTFNDPADPFGVHVELTRTTVLGTDRMQRFIDVPAEFDLLVQNLYEFKVESNGRIAMNA